MLTKDKDIDEEIRRQREILEYNLNRDITADEIIKLSDEMDQLIVSYYNKMKNDKWSGLLGERRDCWKDNMY